MQSLKAQRVDLYAVGFKGATLESMEAYASEPTSQYAYRFEDLAAVQSQFVSRFCTLVGSPSPPVAPPPPASSPGSSPSSSEICLNTCKHSADGDCDE